LNSVAAVLHLYDLRVFHGLFGFALNAVCDLFRHVAFPPDEYIASNRSKDSSKSKRPSGGTPDGRFFLFLEREARDLGRDLLPLTAPTTRVVDNNQQVHPSSAHPPIGRTQKLLECDAVNAGPVGPATASTDYYVGRLTQ
jgi:hypothetical protein